MIVWYNKKRWALSDHEEICVDCLCHLISVDDTIPQYKTVACTKVEWSDPGPDYWDRRDNKLGLQTGRQ